MEYVVKFPSKHQQNRKFKRNENKKEMCQFQLTPGGNDLGVVYL